VQLSLVSFQLCNFCCQNFVQKIRAKNVDEIDSWCQFHQRFLCAFFVHILLDVLPPVVDFTNILLEAFSRALRRSQKRKKD